MTTSALNNDVTTMEQFVSRMRAGDLPGVLELVAPEAVWYEADSLPWCGEWRGPDGFAQLVGAINTPAELTLEDYAVVEAGDLVEVRINVVFTSRTSGRRLPMEVVEHYTVRDGKVYGANVFYKDTQAVNELVKNG